MYVRAKVLVDGVSMDRMTRVDQSSDPRPYIRLGILRRYTHLLIADNIAAEL